MQSAFRPNRPLKHHSLSPIQTNAALDCTMTVPPGNETASELYPSVGVGAAVSGDPQDTYAVFLTNAEADHLSQTWFFWE